MSDAVAASAAPAKVVVVRVVPCLVWRMLATHVFAVVAAFVVAAGWTLYQGPLLPHRLLAGQVLLAPRNETLSFDMPNVQSLCQGSPVAYTKRATLTLAYDACDGPQLQLIPLVGDAAKDCTLAEGSVAVRVSDVSKGCKSQFLLIDDGGDGKSRVRPFAAQTGMDLVLKEGAALLGNVPLTAVVAETASVVEADPEALLGDARGKIELSATSMQLDKLAVGAGTLHLDFDEASMGFVTVAKVNGKDRLAGWRLIQFGIAFGAVFGAAFGASEFVRRKLLRPPYRRRKKASAAQPVTS